MGKLICERVTPFERLPKQLWLQFEDKAAYDKAVGPVMECLKGSEGHDQVVIWLSKERAKKILPANWKICANRTMAQRLYPVVGENNVKLVEKGLKR